MSWILFFGFSIATLDAIDTDVASPGLRKSSLSDDNVNLRGYKNNQSSRRGMNNTILAGFANNNKFNVAEVSRNMKKIKYKNRNKTNSKNNGMKHGRDYLTEGLTKEVNGNIGSTIQEAKILHDVNQSNNDHALLDFAIVGFGKSGTSSLFKFFWMEGRGAFMGFEGDGRHEVCPKSRHELYERYEKYLDAPIMKGLKCPCGLSKDHVVEAYQKLVPHPKLIVVVRHPVTHFQSSYNFFYRKGNWGMKALPTPEQLIGHCSRVCDVKTGDMALTTPLVDDPEHRQCLNEETVGKKMHKKVCTTQSSMFHYALSRLQLTNMTDNDELDLLDYHKLRSLRFDGSLFLLETSQYGDLGKNNARGLQIRNDLESFIGFPNNTLRDEPFPPPGSRDKLISICDDEHAMVRKELVERGRRAARWIIDYFLKSDKVIVSNRDHFIELVEAWGVDPCIEKEGG